MKLYHLELLANETQDEKDAIKHAKRISNFVNYLNRTPIGEDLGNTTRSTQIHKNDNGTTSIHLLLELEFVEAEDLVDNLDEECYSFVRRDVYNYFELKDGSRIENTLAKYHVVQMQRVSLLEDEVIYFYERFNLITQEKSVKIAFNEDFYLDEDLENIHLDRWFQEYIGKSLSKTYYPPLEEFGVFVGGLELYSGPYKIRDRYINKNIFETSNILDIFTFIDKVFPCAERFYNSLDELKQKSGYYQEDK